MYKLEVSHPPTGMTLGQPQVALGRRPLDQEERQRIMRYIAEFEGHGLYGATNRDGEFEGRFRNHPAAGRYHIGLSYGFIQFTQDSGNLGRLLRAMNAADPAAFRQIFGPSSAELIRVTNLPGPPSRNVAGGRSTRVQPVDGSDLWTEPWLGRFRQAADYVVFQQVQRDMAIRMFLDPMVGFCRCIGLDTQRSLTMAVDRAVNMGLVGAKGSILSVMSPLQSAEARTRALATANFRSVRDFQHSAHLQPDGVWGPKTHIALINRLCEMGALAGFALPGRDAVMDRLVDASAGQRWHHRVQWIRRDRGLSDVPYA